MAYTFDWPNKRIILSSTTTLDLRDLWSRWQEWINTWTNSRFAFAMDATWWNPIDVSLWTYIPCYIFLINWWKVRPMESNHTLNVTNGIIVDATWDPFVDTLGTYRVNVRYQQPVQAISFDAWGGWGVGWLTVEEHEIIVNIDRMNRSTLRIEGTQIISEDSLGELQRWNMKDENGNPTTSIPYKREKVW